MILAPRPSFKLRGGDHVVAAGQSEAFETLRGWGHFIEPGGEPPSTGQLVSGPVGLAEMEVAADSALASYLVVHEFGHHFAGLGDEYYTSPVAYEEFNADRVEPWDPNVTALLEPGTVKWADLMEQGTPLPTPWEKTAYEEYSRAYQERRAELRAANGRASTAPAR